MVWAYIIRYAAKYLVGCLIERGVGGGESPEYQGILPNVDLKLNVPFSPAPRRGEGGMC